MSSNLSETTLRAPGLARRLACFVYEGVLLFGVVMISGYLFASLTQQRNALVGRHELQVFLFVVLGIYFGWFWSRSGQTVAMKAWHLRLVTRDGQTVSQARALLRYLLSWLWFIPALLLVHLCGIRDVGVTFAALFAGVVVYAGSAWLLPGRQFAHDLVAGTRLIVVRPSQSRS